MEFAVAIFPTEYVQDPAELARMAQQRGFESLMFPEHTHIPASRARAPGPTASCVGKYAIPNSIANQRLTAAMPKSS